MLAKNSICVFPFSNKRILFELNCNETQLTMGCAFAKSDSGADAVANADSKKTNAASCDQPAPPAAACDPRIPLTVRQKFSIAKSWKGIARAMEPTGVNMFVKLFEENKEIFDLFSQFQELKTKESQRESMELAQHATLVMTTLDEAINSLDKADYCIDYLHSTGKMHRRIPGFKKTYFWQIEKPFLEAVRETLDDRYTDNMETIYKVTIRFILETLVAGFEDGNSGDNDMPNGNTKPDGDKGQGPSSGS